MASESAGSLLGDLFAFVSKLVLILLILGGIGYFGGTWLVSRSLKQFMTYYDKDVLGVEVTMTSMEMHATTGKFHATGLKMSNPEGFNTKHLLLDSEECFVDIDMVPYIKNRGKVLEVEHISLKNTTIYFEKHSAKSKLSNVEQVLANMKQAREKFDPRDPNRKKTPPKLILHKVDLVGVKLKLRTDLAGHGIAPPLVHLKDIHYEDFEKNRGDSLADDIGMFLLGTILKSSMTSSKAFFDSLVPGAKVAMSATESAIHSGAATAKGALETAAKKALEAKTDIGKAANRRVSDFREDKDTVSGTSMAADAGKKAAAVAGGGLSQLASAAAGAVSKMQQPKDAQTKTTDPGTASGSTDSSVAYQSQDATSFEPVPSPGVSSDDPAKVKDAQYYKGKMEKKVGKLQDDVAGKMDDAKSKAANLVGGLKGKLGNLSAAKTPLSR